MKKKIELGQLISMLANLGVVAGIIFLAIELQQNNQLLRAEAIGSVFEARMTLMEETARNEGVANVQTKNRMGESLTDIERTRMMSIQTRRLLAWQRDYFLYQEGILTEELLRANLPAMNNQFGRVTDSVPLIEVWETIWREYPTPDYRRFIEECVLADCATIPR